MTESRRKKEVHPLSNTTLTVNGDEQGRHTVYCHQECRVPHTDTTRPKPYTQADWDKTVRFRSVEEVRQLADLSQEELESLLKGKILDDASLALMIAVSAEFKYNKGRPKPKAIPFSRWRTLITNFHENEKPAKFGPYGRPAIVKGGKGNQELYFVSIVGKSPLFGDTGIDVQYDTSGPRKTTTPGDRAHLEFVSDPRPTQAMANQFGIMSMPLAPYIHTLKEDKDAPDSASPAVGSAGTHTPAVSTPTSSTPARKNKNAANPKKRAAKKDILKDGKLKRRKLVKTEATSEDESGNFHYREMYVTASPSTDGDEKSQAVAGTQQAGTVSKNTTPKESTGTASKNTVPKESTGTVSKNTAPKESTGTVSKNTAPKESTGTVSKNTAPKESTGTASKNTGNSIWGDMSPEDITHRRYGDLTEFTSDGLANVPEANFRNAIIPVVANTYIQHTYKHKKQLQEAHRLRYLNCINGDFLQDEKTLWNLLPFGKAHGTGIEEHIEDVHFAGMVDILTMAIHTRLLHTPPLPCLGLQEQLSLTQKWYTYTAKRMSAEWQAYKILKVREATVKIENEAQKIKQLKQRMPQLEFSSVEGIKVIEELQHRERTQKADRECVAQFELDQLPILPAPPATFIVATYFIGKDTASSLSTAYAVRLMQWMKKKYNAAGMVFNLSGAALGEGFWLEKYNYMVGDRDQIPYIFGEGQALPEKPEQPLDTELSSMTALLPVGTLTTQTQKPPVLTYASGLMLPFTQPHNQRSKPSATPGQGNLTQASKTDVSESHREPDAAKKVLEMAHHAAEAKTQTLHETSYDAEPTQNTAPHSKADKATETTATAQTLTLASEKAHEGDTETGAITRGSWPAINTHSTINTAGSETELDTEMKGTRELSMTTTDASPNTQHISLEAELANIDIEPQDVHNNTGTWVGENQRAGPYQGDDSLTEFEVSIDAPETGSCGPYTNIADVAQATLELDAYEAQNTVINTDVEDVAALNNNMAKGQTSLNGARGEVLTQGTEHMEGQAITSTDGAQADTATQETETEPKKPAYDLPWYKAELDRIHELRRKLEPYDEEYYQKLQNRISEIYNEMPRKIFGKHKMLGNETHSAGT